MVMSPGYDIDSRSVRLRLPSFDGLLQEAAPGEGFPGGGHLWWFLW
jgi:hypothetical protein